MSEFLDFSELENVANNVESEGKKHPLRDVVSSSVKVAYVGGLAFGALADDNAMQDRERNVVIGVALSLGLSEEEANDIVGQVLRLDEKDRIGYFKEVCSQLEGRETALFFALDMRIAMQSDDALTENARRLLGATYKLLGMLPDDMQAVEKFSAEVLGKNSWSDGELNDMSLLGGADEILQRVFQWFEPGTRSDARKDLRAREEKVKHLIDDFSKNVDSEVKVVFNLLSSDDGYSEIHKSLQVQEKKHLLQIVDDMMPKGGLVLTWMALYYSAPAGVPCRIPWSKLTECSCVKGSSIICPVVYELSINGNHRFSVPRLTSFAGLFAGYSCERNLNLLAQLITDLAPLLKVNKGS